eukprot:m.8878 g.8878  ORF g.8878 m.8878 type:complete len:101 (-) comp5405_c0_seq1:657-959(-)
MYVEEWREFMDQSEALFKSDPDRCRFVVQYNDSGQSLIIKATNDKVVRGSISRMHTIHLLHSYTSASSLHLPCQCLLSSKHTLLFFLYLTIVFVSFETII